MNKLLIFLFLVFITIIPHFAADMAVPQFNINPVTVNSQMNNIIFHLNYNPLNPLFHNFFINKPAIINNNNLISGKKIASESSNSNKLKSAVSGLEIAGFVTSASSLTLMITGLCVLFSAAWTNNFIAEAEADNYAKYVEGKTHFTSLFLAGSIISAAGFVCFVVSIPLFSV